MWMPIGARRGAVHPRPRFRPRAPGQSAVAPMIYTIF